MSYIKMKSPNGNIGDVALHNIGMGLENGFIAVPESGYIQMMSPSGKTGKVSPEDLKEGLDAGFKIVEKDLSDMPKEFATGVASGTGNLIDNAGGITNALVAPPLNAAHKYIGAPIDRARAGIVEGTGKAIDYVNDKTEAITGEKSETLSSLAGSAHERANELNTQADEEDPYTYKQNLKKDLPETLGLKDDNKARSSMSDAVRTAGEFVPDVADAVLISKGVGQFTKAVGGVKAMTAGGKAVKTPWLDRVNKFLEVGTDAKSLAKLGVGFAGAGAGASLAKKGYRPEDERATTTVGKIAQASSDIGREIVGMTLGSLTATGAATGVVKGVSKVLRPKEWGETIASITPFSRTRAENKFVNTYGGNVDEQILKIAKDNNLPARLDMLIDNPKTSNLVQVKLRSGFVDRVAWKPFTEVGERTKKEIETTILNDVSPYQMSKEEIGDRAVELIKTRQEAWKVESSKLYDEAERLATDSVIDAAPLKSLLEKHLVKLEYGAAEDFTTTRNNLTSKLKAVEEGKTTPQDLFAFKRALNDHGQTDKSNAGLYGEIADVIDDILTKHAKSGAEGSEFTQAWKSAIAYNKENVQMVKKMDVVRSLTRGNSPRETLDYMSSGRRIKEVMNIVNDKKIEGILKRSKLEDMFAKSGAFKTDDIKPESLTKLFTTKEDILKELMGQKNFNKFTKELIPYAKKYDNAKGIVWTANDQRLIEAQEGLLKKSVKGAAYGGIGGLLTHEITQTGGKGFMSGVGAAIGAITPPIGSLFSKLQIRNIKMLSQIAADPKILDRIIKKAKAGGYKEVSRIDKLKKGVTKAAKLESAAKVLKETGSGLNKSYQDYEKDRKANYEQDPNKRPLGKLLKKIDENPTVKKGAEYLEKLGF